MSDATNTADKALKVAFDVAVQAAESEAISQAPWLAIPIVRIIFSYLLNQLAGIIYTQLDRFVVFGIIDLEADKQRADYDKALTQYKAVTSTPVPDGKAIENARAELEKKLADLIHFNP